MFIQCWSVCILTAWHEKWRRCRSMNRKKIHERNPQMTSFLFWNLIWGWELTGSVSFPLSFLRWRGRQRRWWRNPRKAWIARAGRERQTGTCTTSNPNISFLGRGSLAPPITDKNYQPFLDSLDRTICWGDCLLVWLNPSRPSSKPSTIKMKYLPLFNVGKHLCDTGLSSFRMADAIHLNVS